MRKVLTLVITIMILLGNVPAQAGKPTPQPYPAPAIEQGEAYPEPLQGLPGPADMPTDDCSPDVVCAWGWFGSRWWVSYPGLDFGLTGTICILGDGGGEYCLPLTPHGYNGEVTWYSTPLFLKCGTWSTYYAILGSVYAEIRQPNSYPIFCRFIPLQRRG